MAQGEPDEDYFHCDVHRLTAEIYRTSFEAKVSATFDRSGGAVAAAHFSFLMREARRRAEAVLAEF